MQKTIFQYRDYKIYLEAWLKSQPSAGYGLKGKFARAIGCQTAFVSQVLRGKAQFSLEQADKLNAVLGHSREERAFFLLLVQFTRAGTKTLRDHFQEQIDAVVKARENLKERLAGTRDLNPEDHSIYFGSWIYAAIHASLMIPPFQTKASLAKSLNVSVSKAGAVLEFLVERGLASQKGDGYSVGPMHIHLGNDSEMIEKHHLNWRLRAVRAIEENAQDGLHYSSVVCISQEDATKLKAMCADFLENTREVIATSKEEAVFGLCLDFFSIK